MTTTFDAVYEGGVFRPTRHITLSEGTHVEVLVPKTAPSREPKAVTARLAQIASGASSSSESESASVDHDQILYDRRNQP